jgi:putative membrane protein
MLANDHRQVNERLQSIAQGKNMQVPQMMLEDHQNKMEDLREKSGQEFDKEYMSAVIDMHEKDIDKFEDMRDEVQDPELQSWVENTLASMRQHLQEAEQIKEQVENQQ